MTNVTEAIPLCENVCVYIYIYIHVGHNNNKIHNSKC